MTEPKPTILVVDDDPDILETVALVLEGPNVAVVTARGGVEALERLHQDRSIRLILLDMMMPTMDGWTFRARQLAEPAIAGIPVVVLTGDGRAREKAIAVKAAAFLKKPFDLDEILAIVARFLPPAASAA